MNTDRRSFLVGGTALAACWGSAACAQAAASEPERFGARGDGVSDDTDALQRCIDATAPGGIVRLRRGAVYRVDTNRRPSWATFGGIRLKSRQTLDLNGAELKALPSRHPHGAVVQAYRVDGWRIIGPGRITGERSIHRGNGGEWGMGVVASSASGWTIGPHVEVDDCWGDGIYLGGAAPGSFCEDFLIDRVRVTNCRRNGVSIVAGRDGEIRSPHIEHVKGANPQGGIDLEPDHPEHPNRNIKITGGKIRDVSVGIYVALANENVLITGMDIEGHNSGVIVGNNSVNVRIERNLRIRSLIGGHEGAAIRTVATPEKVRGLHIRDNELSGGGAFVIDIVGTGYRDLVITGNRIYANNRGVQGIARIGGATFTDNICVVGREAGKKDDYFIHLRWVTYGRNAYRNDSAHSMYAAIQSGRDLGGDSYGRLLWKIMDRS